jgi:serine O-acetyltransferase
MYKLIIENKSKNYMKAIRIPFGSGKTGKKGTEKQLRSAAGLIGSIRDEIKDDVAAVRQRDPAARGNVEALLLYSGVHAILAYRVAHRLYLGKKYFSARAVSQAAKFLTGIEIHPGATIGKGLFIDHGSGVVIGETSEIGNNCTLYQGVTLGGTGKDTGKRHPTLSDNVMVGAGAKVLGPITIGENSKIAAGAVVLKDIPADSTAVGIPARVVRRAGKKIGSEEIIDAELDHLHDPDPIAQQIAGLEAAIRELKKEIEKNK